MRTNNTHYYYVAPCHNIVHNIMFNIKRQREMGSERSSTMILTHSQLLYFSFTFKLYEFKIFYNNNNNNNNNKCLWGVTNKQKL